MNSHTLFELAFVFFEDPTTQGLEGPRTRLQLSKSRIVVWGWWAFLFTSRLFQVHQGSRRKVRNVDLGPRISGLCFWEEDGEGVARASKGRKGGAKPFEKTPWACIVLPSPKCLKSIGHTE